VLCLGNAPPENLTFGFREPATEQQRDLVNGEPLVGSGNAFVKSRAFISPMSLLKREHETQ
jgi:hypothetical protein